MKRKSKIIISITGIFLVVFILSGLTYAYFLTQIKGNTNTKSVSITSANLQLTYNDGNGTIIGTNIVPGTTLGEKTFSVTNTGNVSVSYGVYIEDVINEFERVNDVTLTLTCESNKANTTCDGLTTTFPENNKKIITNDIAPNETQTYRLVVEYIEANVDQSVDMGKRLSGKVQIYGSERLTLEFNIANSASGDYGIIQSEPKTSYANVEDGTGTYRFVGVPMGSHTLTIYNSDGSVKGSSPITIGTGNSTSVENTNITVPETTDEITIPVNNISVGSMELGTVKLYEQNNPYPIGTLAQRIIHNAIFVTEEEKELRYAEFMKIPLTKPGQQINKYVYEPDGIESNINTNVTISPTVQNSYWTFGTDYKIDKNNGSWTLINPKKCKYSDDNCIRDLINNGENIYINSYGGSSAQFASSTDSWKGTTNLGYMLYKIIVAPEADSENNIQIVVHEINRIKTGSENILSITSDDYGDSFYFRGDVTNNYLNFNNMCWRVVRIEGDGSIKLILEDKDEVCTNTIDSNWSLGSGNFGYYSSYGYKASLLSPISEKEKSQIYLYYKFQNDMNSAVLEKLKNEDWCIADNDNAYTTSSPYSLLDGTQNDLKTNKIDFYYNNSVRLINNEVTLKCTGTIINRYNNVSNLILEDDMKVGTLTVDELIYAGGKINTENPAFYLMKNNQFPFWTLSLHSYVSGDDKAYYILKTGNINSTYSVHGWYVYQHIRPSVVLKSDIEITGGNGSLEHPYEVE